MLVIDRFEDGWAVIDCGRKTFNLPKELLPGEAREGDVISLQVMVDQAATRARKRKIEKLGDDLFEE